MCMIVMGVQGEVARCMEGVCVWRKCVGDERGHPSPQYLEVCLICKICYFLMCFSVYNAFCVSACFHRLTMAVPRCVVGV